MAEQRQYGEVSLSGLARDSWPLNRAGITNAMVCNVNGPDGFLTVRAGPGTSHASVRAFNRLAIMVVDTSQRQGRWVRVTSAYREVDVKGRPKGSKAFKVSGWVHDGYLCDFIH